MEGYETKMESRSPVPAWRNTLEDGLKKKVTNLFYLLLLYTRHGSGILVCIYFSSSEPEI